MRRRSRQYARWIVLAVLSTLAAAQISVPDQRYKADLLLVVAHPDDDTLVSSYLARAIFDHHKRVAVVFCTPGDSGSNSVGREHARALGLVREIEARRAMQQLGVTNVWFLNGRDTATQDVLISLAAWPSAAILEQITRIIRVVRPDVVLTWLPSTVAGENHGDHQASGVLATEAFDLAGDPAAFPSQLAVPIRQYENALEGLSPWQPKKLYYFSDAFDTGFFEDHGPEYDGTQISPSRKLSYLELAAQSAAAYQTQMSDPNVGKQIGEGENVPENIKKLQQEGFLPEPVRLWLGKSLVKSSTAADVFDGLTSAAISFQPPKRSAPPAGSSLHVEMAGPWGFYHEFWNAHQLDTLESLRPEIAVQPNDTLTIPLLVGNPRSQPATVDTTVLLPAGWKQRDSAKKVTVPGEGQITVPLRVIAPSEENNQFAEIRVTATSDANTVFQESVFVKVSRWVAEQVK